LQRTASNKLSGVLRARPDRNPRQKPPSKKSHRMLLPRFLNKIFTNSLNELKTTFPKLAETGFC
jgi:hypothetical protein